MPFEAAPLAVGLDAVNDGTALPVVADLTAAEEAVIAAAGGRQAEWVIRVQNRKGGHAGRHSARRGVDRRRCKRIRIIQVPIVPGATNIATEIEAGPRGDGQRRLDRRLYRHIGGKGRTTDHC
jgi:hypothetical protein